MYWFFLHHFFFSHLFFYQTISSPWGWARNFLLAPWIRPFLPRNSEWLRRYKLWGIGIKHIMFSPFYAVWENGFGANCWSQAMCTYFVISKDNFHVLLIEDCLFVYFYRSTYSFALKDTSKKAKFLLSMPQYYICFVILLSTNFLLLTIVWEDTFSVLPKLNF